MPFPLGAAFARTDQCTCRPSPGPDNKARAYASPSGSAFLRILGSPINSPAAPSEFTVLIEKQVDICSGLIQELNIS
ncbi:hypothetical protein VFPBJ_07081 [Purpureocillium lilacinum]|uniref:Uncharacterized protein n=1 Tax=Purpureocillium lilacinum TaxID=33203 RepID=A0A179GNL2_PURLI|nr:hypothetical protein VFPBJ_07081 [Purpureocillium lilacinum]